MSLTTTESSVCGRIAERREALIEDLRLHVGLPTGGGFGESAALRESRERLCARAAALGASVELIEGVPRPVWLWNEDPGGHAGTPTIPPTAVCRREGDRGQFPRPVLIAGHLDTVHDPAAEFNRLDIDPDGQRATGPGCVDMKGGLVIALAALEALERENLPISWTLLLNSDEETGSFSSAPTIRTEANRIVHESDQGKQWGGGFGIAMEPATPEGGLVVHRGGSAQFMLLARGKAAHVGRDFSSGVSAVHALARAIVEAQRLSAPERGVVCNIGPLQGGRATNVVPESARAWGNLRFPDARSAEELCLGLASIAEAHSSRGASLEVQHVMGRPAKPRTPGVVALAEVVRHAAEAVSQPLPFTSTAGVCDGNLMQHEGLPTLDTMGVRGGGLHTVQEWIDLGSLVGRCQLLAVSMIRLCSGEVR